MWSKSVFVYLVLLNVRNICAHCPNIVGRTEWGAKQGVSKALEVDPPTHVVIHHSVSPTCTQKENCAALVKSFQKHHMDINHWDDIGYNFLVGEDGNIYEGIGWGKSVSNIAKYNRKSIGICLIGDYTSWLPNEKALTALKELIECGVSTGEISANYRLIGHRQIENKNCPGMKLYQHIQRWSHWKPY